MATHAENMIKFQKIFGFGMPFDLLSTGLAKRTVIDIIKFDHQLTLHHPEYNSEKCTYKGKSNYSSSMVVEEVYGKEAVEFIKSLM
jgi:hypothetical protein